MEWMLILGIVCFSLGGVLLIIGFARLIWWGIKGKSVDQPPTKRSPVGLQFPAAYYRDPWLRAPSMASIISRHKDQDVDSLRVDTDDIYALPQDADPRGMYLHSPDHELSQTESQIDSQIYSVPAKVSRGPRGAAIYEEEASAPAVPNRRYLDVVEGPSDGGSLTEADRSSPYPPVDYSPEHRKHSPRVATENHNGRVMTSSPRSQVNAGHNPQQLSGENLYKTTVYTDNYGGDIKLSSGSVKSLKSLYKYMYTEEPCAGDNEIDYNFISSVH